MDPLSILSVSSNIVAFIDFACKLVSKGHKIYQSADGILIDFCDLSETAAHLLELSRHVRASSQSVNGSSRGQVTQFDGQLLRICTGCENVAQQLRGAVEDLRVNGRRSKWKSTRQAFKSVFGQQAVNDLKTRLEGWRNPLMMALLFTLK
jgi:hypothetical protein